MAMTIAANANYADFLKSKLAVTPTNGIEVDRADINSRLFDYQKDTVQVALAKGQYALFKECGLGKTFEELEFARLVYQATGERVLLIAPLAVADQTILEATKLDLDVWYCRSQEEANKSPTPLIITNYEMIKEFDQRKFAGVVLDEASILKNFTGATKQLLSKMFAETPYRLAATATPAPNDHLELGNTAEFLGIMPSNEMIVRWFINDSMRAGHYRLKNHARRDFWRWVTSWAVCMSRPSDLGYSDVGFELPPLHYQQHLIEIDHTESWQRQIAEQAKKNQNNLGKTNYGQLEMFARGVSSATSLWQDKASTLAARCNKVLEILETDQVNPWIAWVDLNSEADYLKKVLPEAVEVRGSESLQEKRRKLVAFAQGEARIIITKSEIAGFGLNWQHCNQMVRAGANFSYERLHQEIRRCWRFGQKKPVYYHLVAAETDNNLLAAIQRKQEAFLEMQQAMNEAQREHGIFNRHERRELTGYNPKEPMVIPAWLYPHTDTDSQEVTE